MNSFFSTLSPKGKSILLLVIIYIGFISLGLPDTTLGITWSFISKDLHQPIQNAGYISIVMAVCSAISSFSSGAILRKLGTGRLLVICGAITGMALFSYGLVSSFAVLLFLSLLLGFGQGAIDTGMNYYVAKHYTSRDMSWLHGCWGVGATLGPGLLTFLLARGNSWRTGYFLIGSIQFFLALLFLSTMSLWTESKEEGNSTVEKISKDAKIQRDARFWCCVVMFFCYVGCEAGTGLWAYVFLSGTRGFSAEAAGFTVTFFWAMLMAGRFVIGFIANWLGNRRQIFYSFILVLFAAILLMFSGSPALTVTSFGLLGFALAPFYPAMMHAAPERFDDATASSLIGYQGGAGMLGLLALPPAMGWIGAQFSFNLLPYMILILGVVILLLQLKVDGIKDIKRRKKEIC